MLKFIGQSFIPKAQVVEEHTNLYVYILDISPSCVGGFTWLSIIHELMRKYQSLRQDLNFDVMLMMVT